MKPQLARRLKKWGVRLGNKPHRMSNLADDFQNISVPVLP